jgi:Tol biopolymer transport system component/DNA-binding winged helix-turn-helix (wHTH) protein
MATFRSIRGTFVRFGSFQVDLNANKLLREGVPVPIQDKPLRVLRLLLDGEGKVVSREQLRAALWPEDTFVDFEHGVNTAIKKLRQALQDSAEDPTYIETLPRVGYRFITSVEWVTDDGEAVPSLRVVTMRSPGPVEVPPRVASEDLPRSLWRWSFAAIALGVLLLVAASVYLLRSRGKQPDKVTITPFTTFPGFEIAPSFSPDGNQIVFSWFGYEKEFQFDLYVKQVGQERVVQLTHHPAVFLAPAWSPDGRFIAFMRQAEPEATGIYLIPALGGTERKLADITPYGSWEPIAVSWSSDSKWVAFSKADSPPGSGATPIARFGIHLVNVQTTEERVVPAPSSECLNSWSPAFSHDGKYLASVCVLQEAVYKIYIQRPDGTNARVVTDTRSSDGFSGIAWSADSRSLLYASDHHLWRVPLTGGKPEQLLFAQDVESVAVARNGNRIAYAQVRHPSSIWQLQLAGQAKPAGPPTKLITSSRGDSGARISPNSKYIAFQSWRSGSPEIWMCDRDTSNPLQLTSFGGPQVGPPSWSPDSRRLIFDVRASANPELYTVNIEGGPPRLLPTGTPGASHPFWSVDGGSIYFSTEPPDGIWRVSVSGGTAVRVSLAGTKVFEPSQSADGTRLFFYKVEGEHATAWSASVNGGDERPVPGIPPDFGWTPAPNGAYFMHGTPRHSSIQYFDSSTRQLHHLSDLPGLFVVWGPSLSPDAHTFLFSGIERSEGDITLVDGFR